MLSGFYLRGTEKEKKKIKALSLLAFLILIKTLSYCNNMEILMNDF